MDGTASTQRGGAHGSHGASHGGAANPPSSRERGFFAVIDRVYTAMLHWSMNHRWVIVLISALTLFSTVPLLRSGLVPFNFLPEDDESQFQVSIEGPQGTSLEAIRQEGRRAVKLIEEKLGKNVSYTLLTAGDGSLNEASVYVRLVDVDKREQSQQDIVTLARRQIAPVMEARGIKPA
jgi:HAE1 family hydrophobic/amphiphilic exporter-1